MKKIVITALGRRGAAPMYSFEMAKALSKKVQILCVVASGAENIELWRNEVKKNPNFSILEKNTYSSLWGFILKTLCFRRLKPIIKQVQAFKPDVLYSPFGHFWEKYIYANVQCSVKIKTFHDIKLHEGENDFVRYLICHLFNFKTDKAIILSEIFKSTLLSQTEYNANDIVVIPHACFNYYKTIDEPDFSTKYKILFFGRIVRYKGLHILLKAWPQIINRFPNLTLVIAGDGDISDYKDEFESLHKTLELNIRWIKDSEVEGFFKKADLTILPYIDASQSGVIPLANSFGIPAIATNIGGLPGQLINEKTGLIIKPNDIDSLANSVISVYDNIDKLITLKKNSYCYAKTNTWDKSAETLLKFLKIDK